MQTKQCRLNSAVQLTINSALRIPGTRIDYPNLKGRSYLYYFKPVYPPHEQGFWATQSYSYRLKNTVSSQNFPRQMNLMQKWIKWMKQNIQSVLKKKKSEKNIKPMQSYKRIWIQCLLNSRDGTCLQRSLQLTRNSSTIGYVCTILLLFKCHLCNTL